MALISIVVPCYNEEAALPLFYQEITRVAGEMAPVEFEFLFVDDGSRDGTLPLLRQLAREDPRVRFLSFSRNFGKEAAMLAGLQHARGGYAALMDADLQDPPALLPSLYRAVTAEGYDCAATCRTSRQGEPPIRSCFAKGFYQIFNRISDADIVDGARVSRASTAAFPRAFSAGWASAPSGFPTNMWPGQPARQSGPSGSCCATPWRGSWPSLPRRCPLPRSWGL